MDTKRKPDDVWSTFAIGVFTVNDLLMRVGEGIAQPLGQSSARWQVLGRLAYEPQTVAKIARDMDHARQGVQRLADALTQEGLIVYKDHPTDRRTKLLELTPKGHEVLGAIYLRQLAWSKGVMTKLNAEQLANMAHSLENIAQVLVAEVDMGNKGD